MTKARVVEEPAPEAPAAVEPVEPEPPAPPARRADLAREIVLVDEAMVSLRQGEPRAALAILRVYATETGSGGQLAEDAAAVEIEALCRLGDPSAPSRLAAFDARWPHSAQRGRATATCLP